MSAAIPPPDAKKVLFSLFASMPERGLDVDAVRAYFPAKARVSLCVNLQKEDHQEEMRGKFKKTMYGTRDAAQNWKLEYTEMMVEAGFAQVS